jgi:1-acyl-sn-glycerol-3-phosphate acyltransferase
VNKVSSTRSRKPVLGRNPFEASPAATQPTQPEAPVARGDKHRSAATGHKPRAARRPHKTAATPVVQAELLSPAAEPRLPAAALLDREARRAGRFGLPIELPGEDGGMFDVARELLSSDYYLRQWGRIGMRNRSEVVDDFGYDPKYDARLQPLMDVLYTRYFRAQAEGVENVPAGGRALLVANHSGSLPYDALMLKTAIRREHASRRPLRWLVENHVFYMPFVGSMLNRMGALRACQENAERLLRDGHLLAVFPEGRRGQGRLFRDRYKLQRFGRGGFIRLCLRTNTPIIPCAIVGPEEAMPLLFKIENFAKLAGVPYVPITPTFPLLGPLGLLPAPTRWYFEFGAPIPFDAYGPEAADDDMLVGRLSERVRATIQSMVDRMLAARRSVWLG